MPTNATRRAIRNRAAAPRLALSVQHEPQAGECPADRAQLRRWARAALERDATLTLRFVGAREGRALNAQYRGRDYATNVLTFAYDEQGDEVASGSAGPVQADIVICLPVVVREARAQKKPLRDHLAHLVVHGVLHAQGMDHEDDEEAHAMETRETEVLRRFRIADPYL
ncbi:MAG: rRNA maturation RNase YbeY [Burkholderiales bacterium]|nr:MAG: rRNA maturation RNase YbeY [Burkholderiales bacterium]